ncbi:MAG: DUF6677 family protein [Planctomycetaceae bacterium]
MKDPRINLRSPAVAAVLAFLIPGAGHLYQQRNLKAGIFAVCILGTFFGGMILGDWQPVYSQVIQPSDSLASAQMQQNPPRTNWSIGYAAQVLVGLPRFRHWFNRNDSARGEGPAGVLKEAIESDFQGVVQERGTDGDAMQQPVSGRIRLQSGGGEMVVGSFEGKTHNGQSLSLDFQCNINLGRPVFGSPRRLVACKILDDPDTQSIRSIRGSIERPFLDWYQAPRDDAELDRLHGKLSQKFDLALVFTWIAGLLNLMAVWDAFDGPAYGYGDEEPDAPDNKNSDKKS